MHDRKSEDPEWQSLVSLMNGPKCFCMRFRVGNQKVAPFARLIFEKSWNAQRLNQWKLKHQQRKLAEEKSTNVFLKIGIGLKIASSALFQPVMSAKVHCEDSWPARSTRMDIDRFPDIHSSNPAKQRIFLKVPSIFLSFDLVKDSAIHAYVFVQPNRYLF